MFDEILKKIIRKNYITEENYKKFNVSKGLRDSTGKGILVGLTKISEVHGYLVDEGEKISDHGRLLYRNIDIFDIVRNTKKNILGFEEISYLLLFGELPNLKELNWFNNYLESKQKFFNKNFIKNFIKKNCSENIMNSLQRTILNLYEIDEFSEDISLENVLNQSLSLISNIPILILSLYFLKHNKIDNINNIINASYLKGKYSFSEKILYLLRNGKKFSKKEVNILDVLLILHMEHGGGTNSSFTNYVISSTSTDIYSCISASIGSLKGIKHGGASQKALNMIKYILDYTKDDFSKENIKKCLLMILKKKLFDKKGLIYGFGHAVYTKSDPRAIILKKKLLY